jgi:hypothetical protein
MWRSGEAIIRALQYAEANPVERPLGKLGRSNAKAAAQHEATNGLVVVPEDDEPQGREEAESEGTVHTEIQYLLVKLGADMGFDVHVASNDQSRVWKGHQLGDMPRRREHLPQQFDPVTNRTIELIDVLWLDGNAIVAAFEIESTTSIFSGLLRMSDLLAGEQLSRPVDEDRLGGFRFGVLAWSFDEFAVDEGRAGADQGDEVGCVDGAPAVLR